MTFGAIELPGAAWFPTDAPEGPWAWSYGEPDAGPLVAYRALQDATWRRAPDWRGSWSGDLRARVRALVRAVRARAERSGLSIGSQATGSPNSRT